MKPKKELKKIFKDLTLYSIYVNDGRGELSNKENYILIRTSPSVSTIIGYGKSKGEAWQNAYDNTMKWLNNTKQ